MSFDTKAETCYSKVVLPCFGDKLFFVSSVEDDIKVFKSKSETRKFFC